MLLKSATFVCLIVFVHSATIQPRNIPVDVKYEDKKEVKDVEVVPEGVSNYIRNLDAKVQLSPEELRAIPEQSSEEINKPEQPGQSNYLEQTTERTEDGQSEEQSIALKLVPSEDKIDENPKEVIQEIVQDDSQEGSSEPTTEQSLEKKDEQKKEEPKVEEKPMEDKPAGKREITEEISSDMVSESTEVSKEVVTEMKELGNEREPQKLQEAQTEPPSLQKETKSEEKPPKEENLTEPAMLKELPSEPESDENSVKGNSEDQPVEQEPVKDTTNSLTLSSIIHEARNVITSGLKELKESLKTETDAPKPEQWDNLETTVTKYLNEEDKQTDAQKEKPEKQSFIQKIASHFQSLTNEFIESLGNSDEKQSDEKPDEKDEARDNSKSENNGTPCGAVSTFLQTGKMQFILLLHQLFPSVVIHIQFCSKRYFVLSKNYDFVIYEHIVVEQFLC